jgi:hypothetical protein
MKREFATRRDLSERGKGTAGGDQEFDRINAARAPAVLGQADHRRPKPGRIEFERGQFLRHRRVKPPSSFGTFDRDSALAR